MAKSAALPNPSNTNGAVGFIPFGRSAVWNKTRGFRKFGRSAVFPEPGRKLEFGRSADFKESAGLPELSKASSFAQFGRSAVYGKVASFTQNGNPAELGTFTEGGRFAGIRRADRTRPGFGEIGKLAGFPKLAPARGRDSSGRRDDHRAKRRLERILSGRRPGPTCPGRRRNGKSSACSSTEPARTW